MRQRSISGGAQSARLIGTRRYGIFWFASLLSNIGTWMQSVAEPWLVLSISGSSFLLGLDAFAMNAPFWVLTLFGGVMADRGDRGKIIYSFQGIQMLCPLLIVVMSAAGWLNVWAIIFLSLIVGITDALSMPAFASLVPSIVPKKDLKPALALNSLQFNLSRVLGPAVAGLVMAKYGPTWCFGANAISYVPFFLSVYWLYPLVKAHPRSRNEYPQIVAGAKAILLDRKTGWTLLSIFVTAFFCSPLITFSPVIVRETLHASATQFGGVVTAFGIGGLLGPAVIFLTLRVDTIKVSLIAAFLFALVVMASSASASLWELALLLAAGGMLLTVANTSANTFLQSEATNDNRGQTASLFMLAMRGGMSLGNLAAGVAVSDAGVGHTLLVSGLMALVFQAAISAKLWRASVQ